MDQNDLSAITDRLAKQHGVSAPTIKRDGAFATAIEKVRGCLAEGEERKPFRKKFRKGFSGSPYHKESATKAVTPNAQGRHQP